MGAWVWIFGTYPYWFREAQYVLDNALTCSDGRMQMQPKHTIACYDVFGLSACKLLDMQTSNTVWQTFTYQTQTNKRIRCNRLSCPLRAHSIGFVSVIRCIGTCASYRNTSPRVFGYSFRYSGIRVFGFSGIRVFRYSGIWVFRYLGKVESSQLNQLNLEEIKSARQDLELAAK